MLRMHSSATDYLYGRCIKVITRTQILRKYTNAPNYLNLSSFNLKKKKAKQERL